MKESRAKKSRTPFKVQLKEKKKKKERKEHILRVNGFPRYSHRMTQTKLNMYVSLTERSNYRKRETIKKKNKQKKTPLQKQV